MEQVTEKGMITD